jgi:hypothetical protein
MKLTGEWWNELGSKMVIDPQEINPRIFTGTYHTAVGTAQERDYVLAGACDDAGGSSQTVGWAVAFDPPDAPKPGEPANGPSTCAWSGELQLIEVSGEELECITTTWLLTAATDKEDNWDSTETGKDYFFRTKPTAEMIGVAVLP